MWSLLGSPNQIEWKFQSNLWFLGDRSWQHSWFPRSCKIKYERKEGQFSSMSRAIGSQSQGKNQKVKLREESKVYTPKFPPSFCDILALYSLQTLRWKEKTCTYGRCLINKQCPLMLFEHVFSCSVLFSIRENGKLKFSPTSSSPGIWHRFWKMRPYICNFLTLHRMTHHNSKEAL